MAEELTKQQKEAVENRGGKLLVSAAAGSGKTKVLVDRLMLYLTQSNGDINIDDFLIITYTKAAAAELRGKIAAKLNERLADDPGNKHLQRQLQRLYLAKISTVHSFCTYVLRSYAYRLDVPGDFRVAEEMECQLLQLEVIDKLLDRAYEQMNSDFIAFVDSQALGRDDSAIPEIILKVYESARCHVDPSDWLNKCVSANESGNIIDASQTVWGEFLIQDLHEYLDLQIEALISCAEKAEQNGTMEKPAMLLRDTVAQMVRLRSLTKWDDIVSFGGIDYGRMLFSKNCTDTELADRIKVVRENCKKGIEKKLLTFADMSEQVLADLNSCASAAKGLVGLVNQFSKEYDSIKKSRRILDYGDLEHKVLDLLVGKDRSSITTVASEIGDRYVEIMVDEYQDTNAVQDMIFAALTEKRQNCFMVGDVKQSIYQFRLADPGIFLKKYRDYIPAEFAEEGQGRKIMLSKNFRSAGSVIQAVNDVFTNCMYEDVGGLKYGEDEMLVEGRFPVAVSEPEIEFCAIDVQQDTYSEEAAYTAEKIAELLDGTHVVRDNKQTRPITADDIVILLRSPGSVGGEFRYALKSRGIRVNFGKGANLLETEEVAFLRGMLQIIDNPLQDIPLLAVLTSRFIGFRADDLAVIRAGSRKNAMYESLKRSNNPKAVAFLSMLNILRDEAKLLPLSRLIDKIMNVTRMESIIASLTEHKIKQTNLQAFCQLATNCEASGQKELGQFLDFLEASEKKGLAVSADHNIPGSVTIMSIHKSKGLEFPVVFLCGLSRDFNSEDTKAQVLCHKKLGIGLNCVDLKKRIRYPSVAKKAIAAKIRQDSISEEMRILYVAMTRAKDRLIMTYASRYLQNDISSLVSRMDICDKKLLISTEKCPGTWVLLTALGKIESGALFEIGGRPGKLQVSDNPWKVVVESAEDTQEQIVITETASEDHVQVDLRRLKASLSYCYPYQAAVTFPSKMTATQLKGRQKDQEASENAGQDHKIFRHWRVPAFAEQQSEDGICFGNTLHKIMQHIDLKNCTDVTAVKSEIIRLADKKIIDRTVSETVDAKMIWDFLDSEIGRKLCSAEFIVREFKFSVLEDATEFDPQLVNDSILLQGVVDCAIIEPDGITVLDYKTDRVTEQNMDGLVLQYSDQVKTYAKVLSQIYQKDIKSAFLYFFRKNTLISVL